MPTRSVLAGVASGRWVIGVSLALLLAAIVFLTAFRNDPLGTLSGLDTVRRRGHTDHVAHIGETRLFPRLGATMWRVPALDLFRRLTPREIDELPDELKSYAHIFPRDLQFVPDVPRSRPIVVNYPHVPRCYPPGVYPLAAPAAFLYEYGFISFGAANRLFLGVLVAFWFAGVLAWTAWWRASRPSLVRQMLACVAIVYTWYWTLEGFYDVVAVALASLGFEAARRQRDAWAALAAGLCVLVHPRLFMLLPALALILLAGARGWSKLVPRERALFVAGVVAFLTGLAFAAMIQTTVSLHAVKQPPNPIGPGRGPWPLVTGFALTMFGLSLALFRENSRRDALTVLCGGLAFASQRYLAPWYWLPVLPWAMAPPASSTAELVPKMSRLEAISRVVLVFAFFTASNALRW